MLVEKRSDVGYSVSCTTRAPRNGEVNGEDYVFLSAEEFAAQRARGEFAESAEVHGNLYGTLRSEIDRVLKGGQHVVMDIDVQGARQLSGAYPESVLVFLLPPSVEALMERLKGRRTETPDDFKRRVRGAREELRAAVSYQYVVVNDDLQQAYARVASILDAEAVRHTRLPDLSTQVRRLVDELDRRLTSFTPTT